MGTPNFGVKPFQGGIHATSVFSASTYTPAFRAGPGGVERHSDGCDGRGDRGRRGYAAIAGNGTAPRDADQRSRNLRNHFSAGGQLYSDHQEGQFQAVRDAPDRPSVRANPNHRCQARGGERHGHGGSNRDGGGIKPNQRGGRGRGGGSSDSRNPDRWPELGDIDDLGAWRGQHGGRRAKSH